MHGDEILHYLGHFNSMLRICNKLTALFCFADLNF